MPGELLSSLPIITLNDGSKMPAVGLGCWMGSYGEGERCEQMVRTALKVGYRHFDTAAGYQNEKHTGRAIRESGVPRSEIFLTTKLANTDHHRVREAFEASLAQLDCEYVDLYLMHWPQHQDETGRALKEDESPTFVETWKEMEKLLETGKVKSIGVSNFSVKTFDVLLPHVKIVPVVNQVQLHPYLPQTELLDYCTSKGIHLTAYSPLGQTNSPLFTDDTIVRIAEKYGISTGQVLLSWGVQRGTSVVPKSEKEERLRSNLKLVKFDSEDFEAINAIHKQPGKNKNVAFHMGYVDGKPGMFGWTYEQLGWEYDYE
ncbi:hypothetical protein FRC05_002047 [Tulasnella sp. 425]|nr:hypothetical protein FRC05_002047 [Tulasnella sp. 425]